MESRNALVSTASSLFPSSGWSFWEMGLSFQSLPESWQRTPRLCQNLLPLRYVPFFFFPHLNTSSSSTFHQGTGLNPFSSWERRLFFSEPGILFRFFFSKPARSLLSRRRYGHFPLIDLSFLSLRKGYRVFSGKATPFFSLAKRIDPPMTGFNSPFPRYSQCVYASLRLL